LKPQGLQLDVGIDIHGRPISYEEIVDDMKNKKFTSVDHHESRESNMADVRAPGSPRVPTGLVAEAHTKPRPLYLPE
jgi:hypothetical protein